MRRRRSCLRHRPCLNTATGTGPLRAVPPYGGGSTRHETRSIGCLKLQKASSGHRTAIVSANVTDEIAAGSRSGKQCSWSSNSDRLLVVSNFACSFPLLF